MDGIPYEDAPKQVRGGVLKGKVWQSGDEGLEPQRQSATSSCISGHVSPVCPSLPCHRCLASQWLQAKLDQWSDSVENKSTKKRTVSCLTSLLIQLHSSCTAAVSDARAVMARQGAGERDSVTVPLLGKAAALGASDHSVTQGTQLSLVWAEFLESMQLATPNGKLTEECWCCPSTGVSCALSFPWCGGTGEDVTTQLSPSRWCHSRSFDTC